VNAEERGCRQRDPMRPRRSTRSSKHQGGTAVTDFQRVVFRRVGIAVAVASMTVAAMAAGAASATAAPGDRRSRELLGPGGHRSRPADGSSRAARQGVVRSGAAHPPGVPARRKLGCLRIGTDLRDPPARRLAMRLCERGRVPATSRRRSGSPPSRRVVWRIQRQPEGESIGRPGSGPGWDVWSVIAVLTG
jgi:hypothetical protein